jgi:hypothetical protein
LYHFIGGKEGGMAKSPARRRPKLVPASEEMQRLFGLLGQELLGWPEVSARPMFGLRAYFRGAVIFAMLPEKRAFENPAAIEFKLPEGGEKREAEKWRRFELKNERDTDKALALLESAYGRAAGPGRKRR